ncbi:hypothetical protein ENSA5_31110 [Enhygromyxa salina]|uniref:Uncharacterized protein n=1 Tax=Enhygromyxa salina TaxID=215803 RepID=A0A2S9XYD3_9BACT|nr:hypothetical protein [Enhygromyxa salina]PRP97878.1 hypothetical protein ENSA5_31110 [Enhygromyxa salina]
MSFRALLLPCLLLSVACDGDEKAKSSGEPTAEAKAPEKPVDAGKQGEATKAMDAIATVAPDMRPALATAAIVEIDKAALPPSLVEGLEAITESDPDMHEALLAKSLFENPGLLNEVCGSDAKALMQSLATMDPAGRDAALWKGCNMERHGVMTEADRAGSDPLLALVAHMVFIHLSKTRTLSSEERSLLTTMMLEVEASP